MDEGNDYCFQANFDGDGQIYGREGLAWRFQTRGLKGLALFVVRDAEEKRSLVIKRERRFPFASFVAFENNRPLCTIKQRNILFTKYRLEFNDGSKWNIDMPMFTVFFRGESEAGARLSGRIRTRLEWYVRISAGFDDLQMMGTLAYITREKIQCT